MLPDADSTNAINQKEIEMDTYGIGPLIGIGFGVIVGWLTFKFLPAIWKNKLIGGRRF